MSNMSYCRMQNTYYDLWDCVRALEDCEKMSEGEMEYAESMRRLCEKFISAFDDYEPDEE